MSELTITALRHALSDPDSVGRYNAHIVRGLDTECHLWTGAISAKGHGRFQVGCSYRTDAAGARTRRTHVVIAHRFGYALRHSLDALLTTPIVAHRCDNPLCQNPAHWKASTHLDNGRDYANRRHTLGTAHADLRGARGRAHAIRAAARNGETISEAVLAGLPRTHLDQEELFSVEGPK